MRADVVVVGLGSMGASAAYNLAARGQRVIGLDRYSPPHDRGAHGGGSRIIRMAYLEGAEYVPLVRRSYQLWRDLELADVLHRQAEVPDKCGDEMPVLRADPARFSELQPERDIPRQRGDDAVRQVEFGCPADGFHGQRQPSAGVLE